jgi:hypothetical protein
MPQTLIEKARIIREVEPIVDMLNELKQQLDQLPRTAVATRQLGVIICKLVAWRETYEPRAGAEQSEVVSAVPDRDEIDHTLKAYRRNGYFGLTDREKYVIDFFDKNYRNAA